MMCLSSNAHLNPFLLNQKDLESKTILPKIFFNMHIARRNMHIAIESIASNICTCMHYGITGFSGPRPLARKCFFFGIGRPPVSLPHTSTLSLIPPYYQQGLSIANPWASMQCTFLGPPLTWRNPSGWPAQPGLTWRNQFLLVTQPKQD